MQLISDATQANIEGGSWIRRMFEAGIAMKKEFGEDAVCDFSLGNPDLAPPAEVALALRELADKADKPFSMGYMPNGGAPRVRALLANHLSVQQQTPLTENEVLLSCGAAGAINALFKAILNPGDEVLAIAPYFVEYGAYAANHGGVFKTVRSKADTFSLDLDAIDMAITNNTRALIINSPNNPTGKIYSREEISALVTLLESKNAGQKRPVFLVSDEPYRFLAYDGAIVPALLPLYPYAAVVSSFSKNLCIPGERIGYVALSPLMEGREKLAAGIILANRILGYVNPPVVGQYIIEKALNSQVDASIYLARRNVMAGLLTDAGYEFFMPQGAFYFFPKAPGGDDIAFTEKLRQQRILAVPGTGFGGPGYFRLAFCVDEKVILRAADGLKKAIQG